MIFGDQFCLSLNVYIRWQFLISSPILLVTGLWRQVVYLSPILLATEFVLLATNFWVAKCVFCCSERRSRTSKEIYLEHAYSICDGFFGFSRPFICLIVLLQIFFSNRSRKLIVHFHLLVATNPIDEATICHHRDLS